MYWLIAALYILSSPAQDRVISPDAFEQLAQAETLNCVSTDDVCLAQEFALRGGADQSVRRPGGTKNVCPDDEVQCLKEAWRRIDRPNLARLVAIVNERGWPPLDGEAGMGAWYIAQHADATPGTETAAFRDTVLPLILNEVRAGRLKPDTYSRMSDRSALARGERQPFGSITMCKEGHFDRSSVSSVEEADERRREIGMDIMLSESLTFLDSYCADSSAQLKG